MVGGPDDSWWRKHRIPGYEDLTYRMVQCLVEKKEGDVIYSQVLWIQPHLAQVGTLLVNTGYTVKEVYGERPFPIKPGDWAKFD